MDVDTPTPAQDPMPTHILFAGVPVPMPVPIHHTLGMLTVWRPPELPEVTKAIFANPELAGSICGYCRQLANVVATWGGADGGAAGRIVRTLCDRCRTVVGLYGPNRCPGLTPDCVERCYVDPCGAVAPLCRGCHQHERHRDGAPRRPRRRRGGRRRAVAAS